MAVFLKIDKIDGGATEKNHKGWVKVESLDFHTSRNLKDPFGAATSREAGHPYVSEITVTKPMDQASIALFGWSVSKFDAKQVKIDVLNTGREEPFTTYTLENAVISGYSLSAHGDDMAQETIRFNFTKIQERFLPIGEDMKPGSPVIKGIDLATAAPIG